jgi:hypothetical protein
MTVKLVMDGAPDGLGCLGEQATATAKAKTKAGPSTQAAKAPPSLRMTLYGVTTAPAFAHMTSSD